MNNPRLGLKLMAFLTLFSASTLTAAAPSNWTLIDNFEQQDAIVHWGRIDPDNNTDPFVENPQVTETRAEPDTENHYLIKKPAAEGIVGNRKALSYRALPRPVAVGETATLYTRVNVEYFPNNHSFGLSNLSVEAIAEQNYNAFEPMIRITDKAESNGDKNDGTLMVMVADKAYSRIQNPATGESAKPMATDIWYELWWVVNNAPRDAGGQRYDLYVRGGEFESQQLVFSGADFRIQRELPLINFIAICNTGPARAPYGNGGVRYDDIYMASGVELSLPGFGSL